MQCKEGSTYHARELASAVPFPSGVGSGPLGDHDSPSERVLTRGEYYYIAHHGRFFALFEKWEPLLIEEEMDPQPDKLVCVAVYRKGAEEVMCRLEGRVEVKRSRVICRACRKQLGIKRPHDVPTDLELAAEEDDP